MPPRTTPPDPLGAMLREARDAKGLSQDALAATCGISQSTISAIERGGPVDAREAVALCDALGLDLATVTRIAAQRGA